MPCGAATPLTFEVSIMTSSNDITNNLQTNMQNSVQTNLPINVPSNMNPTSNHNLSTEINSDTWLQHNKLILLEVLKASGVQSVSVQYAGEGDEGAVDLISFTPSDALLLPQVVKVLAQHSTYDTQTRLWSEVYRPEAKPITDALEDFCFDCVVQARHGGFENNEGGGGTLNLDVVSGTCTLDHYINLVDQEYSHHEF